MGLPLININNLQEVTNRIKELKDINLCASTLEDIRLSLFNSITIPTHTYPQIKGSKTYRALINDTAQPFESIKRISYNPKPSKQIGRANLAGESVFYASIALDSAAIEVCQDDLRASKKREFYLTIGQWTINRDLEIDLKCHSKVAQDGGTDLAEAAEAVDPMMRKDRTEEEYQIFLLESQFFSDQFAKDDINCPNDYLFSALCSSQLLNNPKSVCDGVWYPSVAYKYKAFNAVYKPDLIDAGILQITEAYFLRLVFEDRDNYPHIEELKKTTNFDGDTIIWDK